MTEEQYRKAMHLQGMNIPDKTDSGDTKTGGYHSNMAGSLRWQGVGDWYGVQWFVLVTTRGDHISDSLIKGLEELCSLAFVIGASFHSCDAAYPFISRRSQ
ncbi:hypothetical protein KY290_027816 [Solanum tuberosum]|uniref:Uncharacterized protein n=1 Tax=Solanum tuberosum TaxID=4113 RepID=A0ABQ7UHU7_SOLTU|nr:hypothetical protein KY285_026792 [Solanum tuberosum]KAH0748584.1 hypothetical protein KY290_027816 [Solanum tuberosum]